jgi:hypothetical protein
MAFRPLAPVVPMCSLVLANANNYLAKKKKKNYNLIKTKSAIEVDVRHQVSWSKGKTK